MLKPPIHLEPGPLASNLFAKGPHYTFQQIIHDGMDFQSTSFKPTFCVEMRPEQIVCSVRAQAEEIQPAAEQRVCCLAAQAEGGFGVLTSCTDRKRISKPHLAEKFSLRTEFALWGPRLLKFSPREEFAFWQPGLCPTEATVMQWILNPHLAQKFSLSTEYALWWARLDVDYKSQLAIHDASGLFKTTDRQWISNPHGALKFSPSTGFDPRRARLKVHWGFRHLLSCKYIPMDDRQHNLSHESHRRAMDSKCTSGTVTPPEQRLCSLEAQAKFSLRAEFAPRRARLNVDWGF
ncbi:hypothetical protein C8R44DRAFT_753981 [Mycena epipterygia]|nr:hypothetical protein C8R44DRAFT_753981 [Mycena epipterygia]